MARKRLTILKFVVALPLLYFCLVGFIVTITGRGFVPESTDDSSGPQFRHLRDNRGENEEYQNQHNNHEHIGGIRGGNWELERPLKMEDSINAG